jgi:D-beta-D-heptose 7-phosphate kinase/D-beta-D-heptose 1-phosphate adenosyltransferase
VTLFDEDTPQSLIAALLPDVLAKGGDYALDQIVGGQEVRAAGGEVVTIPFLPGYSTTDLMNHIKGNR